MSNGTTKKKKRIVRQNGVWSGIQDANTPPTIGPDSEISLLIEYYESHCSNEEADGRLLAGGPDF